MTITDRIGPVYGHRNVGPGQERIVFSHRYQRPPIIDFSFPHFRLVYGTTEILFQIKFH
jgi:hypothetical protein